MSRKAKKDVYAGMKGWEVQYLKKAESYGHLETGKGNTSKQGRKYATAKSRG